MILVTGAGGTVGSEVARQLRKAGAKLRAAYNNDEKIKAAKAKGPKRISCLESSRAHACDRCSLHP